MINAWIGHKHLYFANNDNNYASVSRSALSIGPVEILQKPVVLLRRPHSDPDAVTCSSRVRGAVPHYYSSRKKPLHYRPGFSLSMNVKEVALGWMRTIQAYLKPFSLIDNFGGLISHVLHIFQRSYTYS